MNGQRSIFQSIISLLVPIVIIGLVVYVGFYVAKGIFAILSWLSPLLLIIALLVNYKVVLNYGKWLINKLTTNTLYGILMCLVTIFLFPLVAAWLCFKAVLSRQVEKTINEVGGRQTELDEYVDYEEVDSEIHEKKALKDSYDSEDYV